MTHSLFKLFFVISSSNMKHAFFLLAMLTATMAVSSPPHVIIKSACSSTLYPRLCFSTITSEPDLANQISSHRDVIQFTLKITTRIVQHTYFTVENILTQKNLTERQRNAFHDCLQLTDDTLYYLDKAKNFLQSTNSLSLKNHADDIKTLISSTITNQATCLDGFSHDVADKIVRKLIEKKEEHVKRLCSNALAMINNLTDTHMQAESSNLKLTTEEDEIKWPEWMSADDRRIMLASTVNPNVVVAQDGSGNYDTVSAAVAAAPTNSKRYVIKIKAGAYRETVSVPKEKINIMFIGEGSSKTIITASKNVKDENITTFDTATVAADGKGFLARDITFQNNAGAIKEQAVAFRVGADLSAFYKCSFTRHQDTLYVHRNRQFFVNCFIAGTVDFIFGNSAVVFQDCDIKATLPLSGQKNMVTAQGRDDINQDTGIVIQKCRFGATKELEPVKSSFPTYFGRPWKKYSRVVIMQSTVSDVINPAGWYEWKGHPEYANTLYYAEYNNNGVGADTSNRVNWKGFKVITSQSEVRPFTVRYFIAGETWLSSTTFPYSLDF